ncbi:RPB7 subunit of the RNA polymerase III [Cryptosporidium ryanae]|uniref:RPB7 subunit of the RNA polymerase III n=1 Tax=Cryptosporidium ryanae TaxID=515981 RepID=UPI00351A95BA|nr:RPB7 subunit of the RNA polymerase III [Cryptosporidium ryanae]
MFGTITIEDKIPIFPDELEYFSDYPTNKFHGDKSKKSDPLMIMRNRINEKYINRIVKNAGLITSFIGFDEVDHADIDYDSGALFFKVSFQMISFRPYVGEVIEGIVVSSDSTGLTVSLGFFSDIKIPCIDLREPKSMNMDTMLWSWDYENHKLFYLIDSKIRFRVTNIIFNEQSNNSNLSPMVIIGNVQEDGLGMTSWWC